MSESYWYRQSSKPGFNLTPVGVKGFSISFLNLVAFATPAFNIADYIVSEGNSKSLANLALSTIVLLAAILLFIYSLKYKSDYTYDPNEN